jgi:transcriptional regulator with XRE-family HTH domain
LYGVLTRWKLRSRREVEPIGFAETIKDVRNAAGLTQEQFAARLGVTRQAVSNWENDRNLPDIEVVIAISQTFGVSLDELILGGEDMGQGNGKRDDMADSLIRDGSEGRWMRMSLAMSIVGAVLLIVGVVLMVAAENSVSYVDATGLLHESFWLVPVSYGCMFTGVLVILADLVAQQRRRRSLTGSYRPVRKEDQRQRLDQPIRTWRRLPVAPRSCRGALVPHDEARPMTTKGSSSPSCSAR